MESPADRTKAPDSGDLGAELRDAAARGDTSSVEAKLGLFSDRHSAAIEAIEVAVAGRRWETAAYLADFLRDTCGPGRQTAAAPPRRAVSGGTRVLERTDAEFRALAAEDPALAAEVAENYMDPAVHPSREGYTHLLLLAGPADEFVGHAGLSPAPANYLPGRLAERAPKSATWLEDVFVRPDRRGGGYGRRLVEAALAAAYTAGAATVALGVRDDASEARRLYDTHGFAPVAAAGRWTVMARPSDRASSRSLVSATGGQTGAEAGLATFVVRCT